MCAFGGNVMQMKNEKKSRSQSEKDKNDANNSTGSGGSGNNGGKKGNSKKRTNNSSSSSIVPSNVVDKNKTDNASHTARTHSNHKSNRSNNSKNNHSNNLGGSVGSAQSTNDVGIINSGNNATTIIATSSSSATPTIVKLSPAPASTGSARTSSPLVNVTIMKKYRDEPSTSRTPTDVSALPIAVAPPPQPLPPTSAGGLKFAFEPQTNQTTGSGLLINTNTQAYHPPTMKDSPQSSPSGSEIPTARKRRKATPQQSPHTGSGFEAKREREEKDTKLLQNGAIPSQQQQPPPSNASFPSHHMLGNQINPSGNYAKNMTETLNMEIEAHSIFANDAQTNLIGPQYPGRKDSVSLIFMSHFKF